MRLIFLGAPGAGKGTQADIISQKLDIPHISTGDIFRYNIKNGTELGKLAKQYMDKGQLVPDDVTVRILRKRIEQEDCKKGFILDGFPRTVAQADALEIALKEMKSSIEKVIDIEIKDEKIIKRMTGRRVCSNCGATYHIVNKPSKIKGKCDACNKELIIRKDDNEQTVKERLDVYHAQTEPLINYYRGKGLLVEIDGDKNIEDITKEIMKVLTA